MDDLPYTHISSLLMYAVRQTSLSSSSSAAMKTARPAMHSLNQTAAPQAKKSATGESKKTHSPISLKEEIYDGSKTSLGRLLLLTLILTESRCSAYGCTDHDYDSGNHCYQTATPGEGATKETNKKFKKKKTHKTTKLEVRDLQNKMCNECIGH